MNRRPPRSTRLTHSFPTRRSSDLFDTFFRDFLGSNTSVSTAGQRNSRDSQIDLRGLGLDGTLILVDGRRIADPNVGPGGLKSGAFLQSSIMGIPLEQIERVEVLASSAAGQ